MLGSAIFCIGWSYRQKNQGSVELGVSFSTKYADELGIEWQDAYTALLDVGIDKFRLMSYWDIHEPKKDKYVFDTLDQQMDIAEDYGAKVTLALGQRQPRWPECHIPSWVKNRHQQLLEYLEVVVKRYRNHPALDSFQLENEAANRLF